MINERLLQFIWQFQYFNKTELVSFSGERITILFPGRHNINQGPDFSDARIRIGNTTWAGTVELHIKASDWKRHHHQHDANYKSVILHVVWENDTIQSEYPFPVLELKSRVSRLLLHRYEELMRSTSFIPCEKTVYRVGDLTWKSWKERLVVERLIRKAKAVEEYLQQTHCHWEETFWRLLARNFGIKVNADAFEAIARSIPLKILARQKNNLYLTEAILFGQAGLLAEEFNEAYPRLLQKEYFFLKKKFGLEKISLPVHFLRMRPGNFPTIRLAQLAGIIHDPAHLFASVREAGSLEEIKRKFNVVPHAYWHTHYRFEEKSLYREKKPGRDMIDNIIINTIIPVLFTYGKYHDEQMFKDKALRWLEEIRAENNSISSGFKNIGIGVSSAWDSQALIELKNEYCNKKRCLECAAGVAILRQAIQAHKT